MSFHPITTTVGASRTWNETGPGQYSESTVLYGSPRSYLKITRGKPNAKTGLTTASMSRVLEKDTLVNGVTKKQLMTVTVSVSVPLHVDFTTAVVDEAAGIISEFFTASTLDRILKGEQ
jgi:hypothetical protein